MTLRKIFNYNDCIICWNSSSRSCNPKLFYKWEPLKQQLTKVNSNWLQNARNSNLIELIKKGPYFFILKQEYICKVNRIKCTYIYIYIYAMCISITNKFKNRNEASSSILIGRKGQIVWIFEIISQLPLAIICIIE